MDIPKEYYSSNYLPEDLQWGPEFKFIKREYRLICKELCPYPVEFVESFIDKIPCNGNFIKRITCKNGSVDLPFSTFENFWERWVRFKKLEAFL